MVEVDRLDRVARQEVDGVERLAEAQQVLVVGAVADPPAAVEVGHVRRAADGPEGDPVAAELDVVVGVAGVEREARRRRPDQLGDHRRVEPDALRIGRRPRRRPRAGPRARRRRGSPSRSRTARAASRGGWPRARRPRRPRSAGSASAAGPTVAAAARRCAHGPRDRRPVRRRRPSPAAVSMSVTRPTLAGTAMPRPASPRGRDRAGVRMSESDEDDEQRQQPEMDPGVGHLPGDQPPGVVREDEDEIEQRADREDRHRRA